MNMKSSRYIELEPLSFIAWVMLELLQFTACTLAHGATVAAATAQAAAACNNPTTRPPTTPIKPD